MRRVRHMFELVGRIRLIERSTDQQSVVRYRLKQRSVPLWLPGSRTQRVCPPISLSGWFTDRCRTEYAASTCRHFGSGALQASHEISRNANLCVIQRRFQSRLRPKRVGPLESSESTAVTRKRLSCRKNKVADAAFFKLGKLTKLFCRTGYPRCESPDRSNATAASFPSGENVVA